MHCPIHSDHGIENHVAETCCRRAGTPRFDDTYPKSRSKGCHMDGPGGDELVTSLPIHLTHNLGLDVQLHQFPLLTRPLETPPSAARSGKRITARIKPNSQRLEIHVPADTRPEVWNPEKARDLGAARLDEDPREHEQALDGSHRADRWQRFAVRVKTLESRYAPARANALATSRICSRSRAKRGNGRPGRAMRS